MSEERIAELALHWYEGAERARKALAAPGGYGLKTGMELDHLVRGLSRNDDTATALRDYAALRALVLASTAMGTPWPLHDCLSKLIDATEHLLTAHGCDKHGHEEFRAAVEQAKVLLPQLRTLSAYGVGK